MAMVKLQYLLRAPAAEELRAFRDRALAGGARLLARGPARLKLTFTAEEPPRLSVVPFRRDSASPWCRCGTRPRRSGRGPLERPPAGRGLRGGLPRRDRVPRAYRHDWPEGRDTPGGSMLTLLHRRAGLTDAEFLRRWHDGHSHLALEVHPLWTNCAQRLVAAPVLPGSPPLCGVVEEQFRTRSEVLDPAQLFGGWRRMVPNMLRVFNDVRGFLDLAALENYLVTERWFRS